MIKFSFEVPIAHLEDFEDLQDFHFSLSMLYKNPRYHSFMKQQAEKGLKTVWLDNSYNELLHAEDALALAKLANEIGCKKVIAPDDPSWESKAIYKVYDEMLSVLHPSRIIVVIADRNMMLNGAEHSVKHFAYSYWNRIKIPKIEDMLWARDCHFLGMLTVKELQLIKPPSCDTSMPIKIALKDWTLDKWEDEGSPHIYTHEMLEFFNMKMNTFQIELARKNITDLKERVNGGI